GKPKKLTEVKHAEIEELSKVGDREGIGVESNENEVIQKSADIGVEEEMMNIGHCYRDGIEVGRKEKCEWYMKRVKGRNVGGNFDPRGTYCQSEIVAEKNCLGSRSFAIKVLKKTCENWNRRVNACWYKIMGDSSKFRREEFGPEQVLTFNATAGQVVKGSVKMELNQSKEKMELKELAKNLKNLTKEVTLYLPLWSKPLIFDPGGMFIGRSKELSS
ncbi:6987_t:CDS:2, partial [Gigaspora rosea]